MTALEILREEVDTAERNDDLVHLQPEVGRALLEALDAIQPALHRLSSGRVYLNGPILDIETSAVVLRVLGEGR